MSDDSALGDRGDRTRLVVLYGGRSAEHEVSCVSARHVLAAADPNRYEIEVVGIGTDGRWVEATTTAHGDIETSDSLREPDDLIADGGRLLDPFAALRGTHERASVGMWEADTSQTVVWPVLHGPMGEDGSMQGLFEVAGVAYVGAGVAGSAAAMDKALAKTAFSGAGIPQARWLSSSIASTLGAGGASLAKTVEADLGWPVYVKPANMGSTIGISKASSARELADALDLASCYDDHVVIEENIAGRELEIGVLGLDPLRVSVVGEIVPSHDFYDFDDKYRSGTADLRVPADLPDEVCDEMAMLAVAACRALQVDSMARVDFFYEQTTGRLMVNEINTLPGFTPISMYPRMWEASGVSYSQLVDELVSLAQTRHGQRSGRRTSR